MKLLFAIKSMDVPGGGAERVLSIVASGLAAHGHDVTILTFDAPGGESFYDLDPGIRRVGLGIGPTSAPTGPGDFVRRIPVLRKAVRALGPDVAVGFMHSMFVPMGFSMVGTGIPLVASEHTVPEYYRGRRAEFALFEMGCRLARRVTVISDTVRSLFPHRLQDRMTVIPDPVVTDPDRRADPAGTGVETKILLSVGRFEPEKDHATLIRAFAAIAKRFPDWTLRIVGDGSLRKELESDVTRLDIGDRVVLAGPTNRIEDEYAAAHLMAVPSRFESFGMATAEALAAGLPVVGFADCPGTNELLKHGENGWLVTVAGGEGRSRALADGLSALMNDDALRVRLGYEGPGRLRDFEPETVIDRWECLLADTAGGSS